MEGFKFEMSSEKEPKHSSRIKLSFMRHSEKIGQNIVDPVDKKIALTPKGREEAIAQSSRFNENQTLAISSSRDRTQETALYALAGQREGITGEESLDELKEKVNAQMRGGANRLLIDDRLNFPFVKGSSEHLDLNEAYEHGRYLNRILEKHDEIMGESSEDRGQSTYALQARNVAQIVRKYVKVALRWHELVNKEESKYKETLERILSTHGGVGESFLAEVIERTKGRNERDRFVEMLPNGFNFSHGFEIFVETKEDGSTSMTIALSFANDKGEKYEYKEKVPISMLDSIISDYSPDKK